MTRKFEAANYLESPEGIAEYLDQAIATGEGEVFMSALEDVLKSRVFADVAQRAGVNRVSLYRAVRNRADTRVSTMRNVLEALGCRLAVVQA